MADDWLGGIVFNFAPGGVNKFEVLGIETSAGLDPNNVTAFTASDFGRTLTGPSIMVSHGGVLRVLRRLIEDFPLERAVNWFPPQDSVIHFVDGNASVYPAGESWDD